MNALLDTHFPNLILESSLHELVGSLSDLTDDSISTVGKMDQLRGLLGAFKRKHAQINRDRAANNQKKDQRIPVYRVEVLQL